MRRTRWTRRTKRTAARPSPPRAGHARLLERFGPDPAQDDFEALFQATPNAATLELLARSAPPADVTPVVRHLVESAGWYGGTRDNADALQRRLQDAELMPKPGDRWRRRGWEAAQMEAVLTAFGLDVPAPAPATSRRRR